MRCCTVRSLAKVNLDLRILHKRPDGFHELRTVFQTISLADTIEMEFAPSRRTSITLDGNVDIPDNLVARAAAAVFAAGRISGTVRFRLNKRIPLGAGLGGGSSNAAAVLLALPALAGRRLNLQTLSGLGAALGSDVPFFLHGGTALGLGRGTELYPLPDAPPSHGLLAESGVHVSTAEAYRDLKREPWRPPDPLTTGPADADTGSFGSFVWGMGEDSPAQHWAALCVNHFEDSVFRRHPLLRSIRNRLRRLGASPALMSGSGSSVFGLFPSKELAAAAADAFDVGGVRLHRISLINRRRYRALWFHQLREHVSGKLWPPQSRYAQK